jgi:AP2-associated kinase
MMNRRLRERLTEIEILQIFVDVCEGVAYMHNSRPPLLHRDLKVENILQASATSFKLCDFGSATTVATRPPSNMQEVRVLEEDLNRHTTLQYRAPEMIDPHLRRPIDEKSDVWALGVLLYKLCYYTTPFEEHGPLAILNVQYRIPPYPIYSSQMNALVASMLREHGSQRPSVFELLAQVHRLRGTKSPFQYSIPPQPLAARIQPQHKSPPNPVHSTISYRQGPTVAASVNDANANASVSPLSLSRNAGVQARDKVLEAIAPMRRGRPTASKESSRSSSPVKNSEPANEENWLEDEDKAWQAVTAKSTRADKPHDDAWEVGADRARSKTDQRGFGDDFGEQLWKSTNPNSQPSASTSVMKPDIPVLKAPARPTLVHRISDQPTKPVVRAQDKDAFDGLGLSVNDTPAPTLAEARKFRTGLAIPATQHSNGKSGNNHSVISRFSPSPRPSYSSPSPSGAQSLGLVPNSLNQNASGSSWSSQPPLSRPGSSQPQTTEALAAESKFPSLEELDASFDHQHSADPNSTKATLHAPSEPHLLGNPPTTVKYSNLPRPNPSSFRSDGIRSEQVSGTAMRTGFSSSSTDALKATKAPSTASASRGHSIRRHRSSLSMKTPQDKNDVLYSANLSSQTSQASAISEKTPPLPPRPSQRDWLTGDDDLPEMSSSTATRPVEMSQPVLRDSPSKRASYIEKSHISIQQARAVTPESLPSPLAQQELESPSKRAHRVYPELKTPARTEHLTENWNPVTTIIPKDLNDPDTASSADEEGPEDAAPSMRTISDAKRRKGRQSSVHDLVDLWGGAGRASPEKRREPQESTRSTVTPLPKPKPEGIAKHRSLATPVIPTYTRRRSISPQPIPSPSPGRPPGTPVSQQNNVASPTSASSRSRPQSMFIFPSKSSDGSAPSSAGLSPPETVQPRSTRRTSISDMVQRYEAIDAVAKTGVASSRSISQKAPAPFSESPALQVSSLSKRDGQTNGKRSPVDEARSSPAKSRSISSGIPRRSPSKYSTTSSVTSEESPEMATPRTRRISTSQTQNSFPPTRKPDESGDVRSPSPERPYQGVGKLIDQWQRKTESEATRTPVPKRVAKRTPLVNGTT